MTEGASGERAIRGLRAKTGGVHKNMQREKAKEGENKMEFSNTCTKKINLRNRVDNIPHLCPSDLEIHLSR